MPRRLNLIVYVFTSGLIIFFITILIPVSSVVETVGISVVVQCIIIVVLHKTKPRTEAAAKSPTTLFKGLLGSRIFLQD